MNLSSKLKAAKTVATSKVGLQVLKTQKHSPVILFTVGTVGVVASTVLACKATLKLEEVNLEFAANRAKVDEAATKAPEQYSENDQKHDIAVLHVKRAAAILKLYGPALSVGALSICALGGSHIILTKRNAGLMAAYATLDKGFKEYRERVIEAVGADKEKELRYPTEEREIVDDEGREVSTVKTVNKDGNPSMYARFFDQYNQNWKSSPALNLGFLRCQQTYANDMLRARGHLMLNEVYDMLGLERTKEGAVVGWLIGKGDPFVDFGIYDSDSQTSIDFVNGREGTILLDFNVAGVVYDLI